MTFLNISFELISDNLETYRLSITNDATIYCTPLSDDIKLIIDKFGLEMSKYKYAFKTNGNVLYTILIDSTVSLYNNYLTKFEWIEYKCVAGLECAILDRFNIAHNPMKFIPLSPKARKVLSC